MLPWCEMGYARRDEGAVLLTSLWWGKTSRVGIRYVCEGWVGTPCLVSISLPALFIVGQWLERLIFGVPSEAEEEGHWHTAMSKGYRLQPPQASLVCSAPKHQADGIAALAGFSRHNWPAEAMMERATAGVARRERGQTETRTASTR